MRIERLNLHDDTSPVFFDSVTTPSWLQSENVGKFFDTQKAHFNKVTYLVNNRKDIFNKADFGLNRTTLLCTIAALCALIGGFGLVLCPVEYKKTRGAFICLSILSGVASLFTIYILVQMQSKVSGYKFLGEWQPFNE